MEMHQVRYFLALCDSLNFTRAAEQCRVAQPSLTRAIKALEAELGGPLFRRERQNTHLTELGRMMLPHFQELQAQASAAQQRAREFARLHQAPLNLGLMCSIGPGRMIEFIAGFQARHPGIELHLRDAGAEALVGMLESGELDVAIFALPDALDARFHCLELFAERFMVTVAPGHRFEQQNAVRLQDLHQEPYLNRANCEYHDHIRDLCRAQEVTIRRIYRSERDDWIQAMVMAGLGFGFTPEFAVVLPGIVARPLVDPEVVRKVRLVTVRGRPHSPAVGAFVREAMRYRWPGAETAAA